MAARTPGHYRTLGSIAPRKRCVLRTPAILGTPVRLTLTASLLGLLVGVADLVRAIQVRNASWALWWAVPLLLSSAAVGLLGARKSRRARIAGRACAAVVLTIASGLLLADALELHSGELMLFSAFRRQPSDQPTHPAFILALLAASLLLADARSKVAARVAPHLAGASGAVVLFALIGRALDAGSDASAPARWAVFSLEIPSAAALLALAGGALLASMSPQALATYGDTESGRLCRRLMPWAGVLPIACGGLAILLIRYRVLDTGAAIALVVVSSIGLLFGFVLASSRPLESLQRRAAAEQQRLSGRIEVEVAERAHLQAVIDQMPEGVLITDAAGRLVGCNPRAKRLARRTPGGIDRFGNPIVFDVRHPDGRPMPVDELPLARAILARESVPSRELQVRPSDGSVVPVLASAAPVLDPGGELLGAVAVFQDISRLKQLERQREEWTSFVAHELRQPVSVLSLSGEMLRRQLRQNGANPEQARIIERLNRATTSLGRMVEDLLDASRLEARRMRLECRPFELDALLREASERVRIGFPSLGPVRLQIDDLPPIRADAARIEQVVSNLLSNAAKYGEPGAEVKLSARFHGGDEVLVTVANRGQEIPLEERERIFERFVRAKSGPRAAGLGIGLYIARGLVQAHGGQMWVEGGGGETRFCFTLPLSCRSVALVEAAGPETAPPV